MTRDKHRSIPNGSGGGGERGASFSTRRTRNYPERVGVGVESGEQGGHVQVPSTFASTKQVPSTFTSTKQVPSTYANTKQVPSTLANTEYLCKYQASTKYFGKYRVLWQVPSTFASSASFSPISKLLDVRSSPEKHHSIPNFLLNLFMAKATRSERRISCIIYYLSRIWVFLNCSVFAASFFS